MNEREKHYRYMEENRSSEQYERENFRNYEKTDYLSLSHPSLTDVKLIIGNGFDLACGLNSSYSAFFNSNQTKKLHEFYDKFTKDPTLIIPEESNIWDFCFYLIQFEKDPLNIDTINWKDVESNIKSLLFKRFGKIPFKLKYGFVTNKTQSVNSQHYINNYLHSVYNFGDKDQKNYYKFLLKQLEIFENRFASYIKKQMEENNYQQRARMLLGLYPDEFIKYNGGLSFATKKYPETNLKSIDTFNYTTPDVFYELKEKYNIKIRHVNGTLDDGAIFGIDNNGINITDDRYIFTKTYRKMKLLIDGHREPFERHFKNAVVFGHSLSEADYSYFFSILDNLNLYEYNEYKSRFIIAFTEFSNDAKERTITNVLSLLDAFDKWKNPNSKRHGLIDNVETSDRIGFVKIQ